MKNILISLVFALVAFALPARADISPTDRVALITELEQSSKLLTLWAEYYAYGKSDETYFLGRADGFLWAAAIVAASDEDESRATLLKEFEKQVKVAALFAAKYALSEIDQRYYNGYTEGIVAGMAVTSKYQNVPSVNKYPNANGRLIK